jgi:hypothetical protein
MVLQSPRNTELQDLFKKWSLLDVFRLLWILFFVRLQVILSLSSLSDSLSLSLSVSVSSLQLSGSVSYINRMKGLTFLAWTSCPFSIRVKLPLLTWIPRHSFQTSITLATPEWSLFSSPCFIFCLHSGMLYSQSCPETYPSRGNLK